MAAPPHVLLVEPDARAAAALGLALSRAGLFVSQQAEATPEARLVVVGDLGDPGARIAGWRAAGLAAPILAVAPSSARATLLAAGVDEVVAAPAWLRDVGLVARLLATAGERRLLGGALGELGSMLALLRAIGALGRSGVLTLSRGFRRGEVRYASGELTSVQAGGHHGQAALHQLLLWSEARFDFRREEVVHRRQIPLPPDELFADAERFLAGIREAAGTLTPVAVFELDDTVAQANAAQIPVEVQGILRLFDGQRAVSDLLEDSPLRAFETLRVILRARELGLLRPSSRPPRVPSWTARLPLERWLLGEAQTVADAAKGARGKKGRRRTPLPGREALAIDWGTLAPRSIGVEFGGLAGVVPASRAAGEIIVGAAAGSAAADVPATRIESREGLEALTDAATRDRAFAVTVSRTATPVSSQAPAMASGEIGPRTKTPSAGVRTRPSTEAPVTQSGEISPRRPPTNPPVPAAAAVLVADLGDAHAHALAAAAAALPAPSAAAPTTPALATVERARVDAVAFTDAEEAFFEAGTAKPVGPPPKVESFPDLDQGYEPVGFWARLRGKTKPPGDL